MPTDTGFGVDDGVIRAVGIGESAGANVVDNLVRPSAWSVLDSASAVHRIPEIAHHRTEPGQDIVVPSWAITAPSSMIKALPVWAAKTVAVFPWGQVKISCTILS